MVVTRQADRFSVANVVNRVDGISRLADFETFSVENFLVADGVQFGKARAKLKLFPVNENGAIGLTSVFHHMFGEGIGGNTEKIPYIGVFQLKEPRYPVVGGDVDNAFLYFTENPAKHVIEMHSDIGSDTSAFAHVAFP